MPPPHAPETGHRPLRVLGLLAGLLLLLAFLSLSSGAVGIPLKALLQIAYGAIPSNHDDAQLWRSVLLDVRLPRVLFAMLAGIVLALAGALAQALFRNPLAEPGLVGITAGGALGAVTAIVLLGGGFLLVAPLAFAGSLLALAAAYHLGRHQPGVAGLLLAGIAVNALCASLIGLLTYLADDSQLRSITFWSMGSLANASWHELSLLGPWLLVLSLLALRYWRALNALLLGERAAGHLGFPVKALRRKLILLMALMVGPLVAATGGIGFVGLVAPHLVRMALGADHRLLLPTAALTGACALVAADWLARIVVMPAELPIGIVTGLVGGPFFIYLLLKGRGA
ncbi:FecCD family ABC transporter permease [Chitinilyticum litopenaei]|uniref:FecCD family ABC transporter permease n=1 Tax=Chitinilyticum litopenaei TaxID=1121276 RepID=UPI00068539C4|nr:iron ABC transporter permease [Chitinilyticum litopenaei]